MVGGEARGARGGPAGHTGPPGKELDSSAEMGDAGSGRLWPHGILPDL